MSKPFTWTVAITVDECWVADGFEADAERIKQAILNHCLGYAADHEVSVKVLKSPDADRIAVAQGYKVAQ